MSCKRIKIADFLPDIIDQPIKVEKRNRKQKGKQHALQIVKLDAIKSNEKDRL